MTRSSENDRKGGQLAMRTPPIVSPQAWEAARQRLCLAAAPTFAIMSLMTGVLGGAPADVLCSAGHRSLLGGMVPMYGLMSLFHLSPWLKLASGRP